MQSPRCLALFAIAFACTAASTAGAAAQCSSAPPTNAPASGALDAAGLETALARDGVTLVLFHAGKK